MLARDAALAQLAARARLPFIPPTSVALLLDRGHWTPLEALSRTRQPEGRWRPRALERLAPRLDGATVERLLAEYQLPPIFIGREDAPGLEALLRRRCASAGPSRALAAWRALPELARVIVASVAVTLARAAGEAAAIPELIDDVVARSERLHRPLDAAALRFNLLPEASPSKRREIIETTLNLLYEEDWPVTVSLWRTLAAYDMPRARAEAYRRALPYPRAWRLAAISWHLRGRERERVLADWLETCRALVASGSGLCGNEIPTPLPQVVLEPLLSLLRHHAGALPRAYVLLALSPAHPELAIEAARVVEQLHPVHRALAWTRYSARFDPITQHARAAEAVATFSRSREELKAQLGTSFFNTQRAWIGDEEEALTPGEWRARAITGLDEDAIDGALDELLSDLADQADQSTAARPP